MAKIGRYTAAFTLITIGSLTVVDLWLATNWLSKVVHWWPVLLIMLGLEYMIFYRKDEKGASPKLAIGLLLTSVIVSATVIILSGNGNEQFIDKIVSLAKNPANVYESGHKIIMDDMQIPVDSSLKNLEIHNTDGDITIQMDKHTEHIIIEPVMYVILSDEEKAKETADQSKIDVTSTGQTMKLETELKKTFIFGPKAKMDLVVKVPASHLLNYDLKIRNGKIDATDLTLLQQLSGKTTNGSMNFSNIKGDLELTTTNGTMLVNDVNGNVHLQSTNGKIDVKRILGSAVLKTTNGGVNGTDMMNDVNIKTTNGKIHVNSSVMDGNWSLHATNGSINIAIPDDSSTTIDARTSRGSLHSDFSLSMSNKKMNGQIGAGKHNLQLKTTNGSIRIDKWFSADVQ